MAFTSKISQGELNSRGATTLPNTPSIGATALKQEFDAPAKVIVAPKHNSLIDELEGTTASANLGAVAPSGRSGATVQAVLNDLSSDLAVVESQAHSHSNKTDCLDYLSDNEGTLNYKGQPISGGSSYTAGNGIQISNDAISAKLDSDTMEFSSGNIKAKNSHTHSNKALLDTYTQTESDLADAVNNKHTHNNKSVIDKFGESSGKPTYNGQPIGGGTEVTWNQITQSGTKIATVSIDGNSTDVYAPTGGGGGGATSLSGLDDVSLSSIQNNQALMYDSATSKWKNKTIAISDVDGLQSALNAKASKSTVDGILDGTSIDSFGDVETALGNKQDSLSPQTAYTSQGDATHVPQITTNSLGQVTGITPVAISLPTVDQTFNGSSTNAQSGVAISGALDGWTQEQTVTTSGSDNVVTFTGLNDSLAYDIYCDAINTHAEVKTKSGSGTAVTVVYKISGDNVVVGTTKCKLRILK